jgi:hypothetical protein
MTGLNQFQGLLKATCVLFKFENRLIEIATVKWSPLIVELCKKLGTM